MYRLVLPDGSSVAPLTVQIKSCVNPAEELMPGGVCAGELKCTLPAEENGQLAAGEEVTLYRENTRLGIFRAEKPRSGSGILQITAYDRVSLLEQELGQWLYELPGWPYTLQDLADLVLEQCGLSAVNELPRLGDLEVAAFAASGITGRKLMQWICQIAGCFCRATVEGQLEYGWFVPTDTVITPSGERFYYMDGFTCADYQVVPVEKVQVQLTGSDIGGVYPDDAGEVNTLKVTGNYLLTAMTGEKPETVARSLYNLLAGFTYTPGQVTTIPGITAGDIFTVVDEAGNGHTLCAMSCKESDGVLTVESTGSYSRTVSGAVNNARYEAITGRVMELTANVEGLRMENRDAQKNYSALTLEVEGISATVSRQSGQGEQLQQQVTALSQTAEGLAVRVEKLSENGTGSVTTATGYTFDDQGLRIAKAGHQMENLLDNTGMYVRRSGEVILQANAAGVQATDVVVRNYLVVGTHARFEDYPVGRTACFYLADSVQM